MELRALTAGEIDRALFASFERHQTVSRCWRKEDGGWTIKDAAFEDQWGEEEYARLIQSLKETVRAGGAVYAAFLGGALKGFASVEPEPFGREREYLDLANIHVSEDARGRGIGRALFRLAAEWAKARGAKKLYISAHSAVESQAFYRAMGCRDAGEPSEAHVEREPFDRQLECPL
jgi:GNAT superfamily N-acetyltransferase